jgi:prophage regulatory protein
MSLDTADRILRIGTVLQLTGLSRSTLYRKVQRGEFPKQIKLSERCAGWRQSAVNAWMRNPMFYSVDDESC